MMALFCACIDNVRTNTAPDMLSDLSEGPTDEQSEFLKALINKGTAQYETGP
jgi:hypothetical protein